MTSKALVLVMVLVILPLASSKADWASGVVATSPKTSGPTCTTNDGKLACNVTFLSVNHRFNRYSAHKVESLTVTCMNLRNHSEIFRSTFSNMPELREMTLVNCKLSRFDPKQMATDVLRRLTVAGTYTSVSIFNTMVDIPDKSISQFVNLEELSLYNNRLSTAPRDEYCRLVKLRVLNLSANAFEDVRELGFSYNDSHFACTNLLEVLDLSYNNLTALYNESFSLLVNLKDLHLRANRLHRVDNNAFFNLDQNLRFLDLSDNYHFKVEQSPQWSFNGYPAQYRNSFLGLNLGPDFSLTTGTDHLLLALNFDFRYHTYNNDVHDKIASITRSGQYEIKYLGISPTATEAIKNLLNLVELRLNRNGIEFLDNDTFSTLKKLKKLEISYNALNTLTKEMFKGLCHLKELNIELNSIRLIEDYSFDYLINLEILILNSNNIERVTSNTFRSLQNLKSLGLFSNVMKQINERAFSSLTSLEEINLAFNLLTEISNFGPLPKLTSIRLDFNEIRSIHPQVFNEMPNLISINIAHNYLESLPAGVFTQVLHLTNLTLSNNDLTTLPGHAFQDLVSHDTLIDLDISRNSITVLDVDLLPTSLAVLHAQSNEIESLSKNALTRLVNLKEIYLQNNFLSHIGDNLFPPNISTIMLSANKVTMIEPDAFRGLMSLKTVTLDNNHLETLVASALMTSTASFTLRQNLFICDCTLEWLKYVVDGDDPQNHIEDYDRVTCYDTGLQGKLNVDIPVIHIHKNEFICPFKSYQLDPPDFCVTLSDNRTFCHLECPDISGCHCYHRYEWSAIVTSCTAGNLDAVPRNISSSSTEIKLDGNAIKILHQFTFLDLFPNLTRLYLNDSQIQKIAERTFKFMTGLRQLFLQQNELSTLKADTFAGLQNLELLWLFANNLRYMDSNVFKPLSSLVELNIRDNRLKVLPNVDPAMTTSLKSVDITNNPVECTCENYAKYNQYRVSEIYKTNITSVNTIHCRQEVDNLRPAIPFEEYASVHCKQEYSVSFVFPLAITTSIFVAILIGCAVVFNYRQEILVLVFSRYGIRLGKRMGGGPPEGIGDGKVYDAFVAYSSDDVEFVAHELVPRLENTEYPYALCLHERNFAVGAYIMESILEAVQCSRRTIVVMSRHFLESSWCRFEFKSAHHHMLEDKRSRLIMIVLDEDMEDVEIEPNINIYLKTNTYLARSDKLFWEKLYYAMPDRPKPIQKRQGDHQTTNI